MGHITDHCISSVGAAVERMKHFLLLSYLMSVLSGKVVTKKADCSCGEERREVCKVSSDPGGMDYIWNGRVTKVNQFPWMVRLSSHMDDVYLCGGSLIASKYVLTAAHCVTFGDNNRKAEEVEIHLGDHDKTQYYEQTCLKHKAFLVWKEKITVHENYVIKLNNGFITRVENDIALLELDEEVDLRHYTPVCLPRKDEADQVRRALALGWGRDGTKRTNAKLNSVEVRDLRASKNGQFLNNDISEDYKGVCQGDSGGPLTYQKGGRHVLIGATSHGIPCDESIISNSDFTRVSFYTDWIYEHMESPTFCSKKTKPTYNCRGTRLRCHINHRYGHYKTCSFRSPSGVRYDVEPELNRDGVTYSGKNSKFTCAIELHEIRKCPI